MSGPALLALAVVVVVPTLAASSAPSTTWPTMCR